jgi:hypothetical protein
MSEKPPRRARKPQRFLRLLAQRRKEILTSLEALAWVPSAYATLLAEQHHIEALLRLKETP